MSVIWSILLKCYLTHHHVACVFDISLLKRNQQIAFSFKKLIIRWISVAVSSSSLASVVVRLSKPWVWSWWFLRTHQSHLLQKAQSVCCNCYRYSICLCNWLSTGGFLKHMGQQACLGDPNQKWFKYYCRELIMLTLATWLKVLGVSHLGC